jgi:hypothetical protein
MLEDRRNERFARDYVAQHAFMITKMLRELGGGSYDVDSYIDIVYPDAVKKDARTAAEIKEGLLERLSE